MSSTPNLIPTQKKLVKEPTETQKDNARLRLRISELEAKIYLMQKQQKYLNDKEALLKRNLELETENKILRNKLEILEKLNDSKINEENPHSAVNQIKTLSTKLSEYMSRNSSLTNNLSLMESQIADLELENVQNQTKISNLANENRQQQSQLSSLSNELNRYKTNFANLSEENIQLKNDLDVYIQKSCVFCDKEKERYKELADKTDSEIDNLNLKCEEVENQYKKLKSFQKVFLKRHAKAFTIISEAMCSLFDIDKQSIPTPDQIMNDTTSISYFIGKIVTNVEKERIFYETKLKHIEGELEKKKHSYSTISYDNINSQTVF